METGEIVYWREVEGFGFIRPDRGGVDVFVHRQVLGHAKAGARVEFVVGMRDRGPYATEARLSNYP